MKKRDSRSQVSDASTKSPRDDQISALLLTTRWSFDFTNITSVTRSIVNTLRFHNPSGTKIRITCAVLALDGNIEQVQVDEAVIENVQLRGAKLPQGEAFAIPEIKWLNQLSTPYYQSLLNENSYNFIIGHAPLLAYGAVNLKGICRGQNSPKVVLMVHTLPKTEKGLLNKALLCTWMESTDIVFSIGETDSNVLKRFVDGKVHEIYIPICPLKSASILPVSAATGQSEVGTTKIAVMVGRKELGYNGINVKLAMAAVCLAVKRGNQGKNRMEIHLLILGEDSADERELKACFNKTLEEQNNPQNLLNFYFLSLQPSTDSKQIRTCMMESTLVLLPLKKNYTVFGLEALTAALAGIPILVSENSGVAALLRDVGDDGCNVVRRKIDFDSNVRAWAEQISQKISKQSKAKEEANKLRQLLLQSTRIGITHRKFISIITGRYLA